MFVLAVKLTLYIPLSQSLKDKRRLRRQVIDRFNKLALIKEVDTHENHQTLTLGFALVGLRESDLDRQLSELIDEIIDSGEILLQEVVSEILKL